MKNMNDKPYDEFLNSVNEGLNSPIPVKWTKEVNSWYGTFNIDEVKYEIFIQNKSDTQTHFLFRFQADGKYDMLRDVKKAFSVIPTLEKAAMDFIEEVQPQAFMIYTVDESATQKMMYDRFCNRVRKQMKYEYLKPVLGFYTLVKDKKGIIKTMLKIVTEQM